MTCPFTVDRERGMLLGVCRGLADHADVPVGLVRLGMVVLVLAGLGFPGLLAYALIGLIAQRR